MTSLRVDAALLEVFEAELRRMRVSDDVVPGLLDAACDLAAAAAEAAALDRDRVLRAAVYAAFDDRDEHGRVTAAAAAQVVRVDALWPLVAAEPALRRAERRLEEARRQIAEAVQLLRETYPKPLESSEETAA